MIAAGNQTGESFAPALDGDLCVPQSKLAHEYFDIKITGITEEFVDKTVVFCAYIKVQDKVYYLDNNKTSESVTGISYKNAAML